MRAIALLIIVGILLIKALTDPMIGLMTWSWLSYMNPHRFTFGFGYTFPFVAIAAGVTFIAFLLAKNERFSFPLTPVSSVWLVFTIWVTISALFALVPEDAFQEWTRLIKIQLMILMTFILVNNKKRILLLVWVIVLSIGYYGVKGGLFSLLTGLQYRVIGPPSTFFSENNTMALVILMVIPLMYFLFLHSKYKWVRYGLLAAMLLSFVSVLGSYSRGALLGLMAMSFFLWLGSRNKTAIMTIVLSALLIGAPFVPQKWYDRMDTIKDYKQDESAMGRINAWEFAVNVANDSPFIGGGFRVFTPELFQIYAPDPEHYADAHSIYFEVLGEQGYMGLILFLMIWLLTFLEARKIKKMVKGRGDIQWMSDLVKMVQVGLIAYLATGAFLGLAYFDLPYHYMSIVVITGVLCRNAMNSREAKYDETKDLSSTR